MMAILFGFFAPVAAPELKLGDTAPHFKLKTDGGGMFDLSSRKGQWTVLYFYPKAGTPGCTKQACAFRDGMSKIRDLGADVFGICVDDVGDLVRFKNKYHLNFILLADPELKAIRLYGAKMPMVKIAKRWTFILDPDLKIRAIDRDVNPIRDAEKVAEKIREFQAPGK